MKVVARRGSVGLGEVVARRGWAASGDPARAAWSESGVPARLAGCRLGTFPAGTSGLRELVGRLRIPVEAEVVVEGTGGVEAAGEAWLGLWGRSWLLWGECGVGKSGLAVGYSHQWVDARFGEPGRVVWWAVPDLLAALRATYERRGGGRGGHGGGESEAEILGRCRSADLLVLDDIGAESVGGSGWALDRLYQVVGHRHGEMLPVVVTSNLAPAELAERIGPRLVWRLVEMCGGEGVVRIVGRNLRDR